MANVKINDTQLQEARRAAGQIENSLQSTLNQCNTLISYVHGAKWEGKSRNTFLSYLEIIQQYHQDLYEAVKLQTTALNNVERYKNDFLNDSSVKEVRNL